MKRKGQLGRIFLLSVGVLLLFTAGAKLWSALGDAKILDFPDPLWGVSNRRLLVATAAIEIGSALCLFTPIRLETKYLLSAWLGANFILYRIALAVFNPGKPCPCLGGASEMLHLSEATTNYLLSAMASYLFLVGLGLYFWQARSLSRAPNSCRRS
jgi:hypothetical protein